MSQESKQRTIECVCPQLGTTDYLTYNINTTFGDLIDQLKVKYSTEVLMYIREHFQNIRKDMALAEVTVKLHYIDREGIRQTIGLFTKVFDLKKKASKFYWEAEPIGGALYI
jgi:hypothetical protein